VGKITAETRTTERNLLLGQIVTDNANPWDNSAGWADAVKTSDRDNAGVPR
jgi:hypothetical protein